MTNMEYLVKKGVPASDLAATLYNIDKEHNKKTFRIFDLNATINRLFTVSTFTASSEAILEWLSTEYVTDIITDFERKKLNSWLTVVRHTVDRGKQVIIDGIRIIRFDENDYYIPVNDNETKISDVYIEIAHKENNWNHHERFLIDKDTEFVHLNYKKRYSLTDLGIEREGFIDG